MQIRPLTAEDEPFLWDILYHAIYMPPGEGPLPYEVVKQPELACYVADWMRHSDDMGFAAEVEERLVGATWLRCWPNSERGFGFIDTETPELSMALLPDFRGRGIGTQLLRQLLSAAREHYSIISLSVSESNPARKIYEREGFISVPDPEGDSITMIKKLS